MRARNWANAVYNTEDVLGLYWRWPFVDLADMIAMWEGIKSWSEWPDGEWPLEFHRENRWAADSGIRRARGTWVYDVGVGMACGGTLIHEICHMPNWRAAKPHGDIFLRHWMRIWRHQARKPTWDAICDQLNRGGVPLEEFV